MGCGETGAEKRRKWLERCILATFWRRWRDSNSRAGYPTYTLSRGASSAKLEYISKTEIMIFPQMGSVLNDLAEGVGFEPTVRCRTKVFKTFTISQTRTSLPIDLAMEA